MIRLLLAALILLATVGCTNELNDQGLITSNPGSTPTLNLPDSECAPTNQDQYVWRPERLQLIKPCVRVIGTVMELSAAEPDGDIHMQLRLDVPYQSLLTAGNEQADGNLIVEAICQYVPPMIEALRICASDPDPYPGPFPHVGDHIWVEGRYVLDLGHNSQAELHPLYRWGKITP